MLALALSLKYPSAFQLGLAEGLPAYGLLRSVSKRTEDLMLYNRLIVRRGFEWHEINSKKCGIGLGNG